MCESSAVPDSAGHSGWLWRRRYQAHAAGFFLGWKATVIAFFIGLIIGGCQGAILLIRRKKGKDEHFAFGPALSVGLMIATFVGSQMMNSYINVIKASFYA